MSMLICPAYSYAGDVEQQNSQVLSLIEIVLQCRYLGRRRPRTTLVLGIVKPVTRVVMQDAIRVANPRSNAAIRPIQTMDSLGASRLARGVSKHRGPSSREASLCLLTYSWTGSTSCRSPLLSIASFLAARIGLRFRYEVPPGRARRGGDTDQGVTSVVVDSGPKILQRL